MNKEFQDGSFHTVRWQENFDVGGVSIDIHLHGPTPRGLVLHVPDEFLKEKCPGASAMHRFLRETEMYNYGDDAYYKIILLREDDHLGKTWRRHYGKAQHRMVIERVLENPGRFRGLLELDTVQDWFIVEVEKEEAMKTPNGILDFDDMEKGK